MTHREDQIIEKIRARFPRTVARIGIGDDASVLSLDGESIVTNDMLVEGVDFFTTTPIEFVAAKSLAANLSDIAAMGGRPVAFLLALALPRERLEQVDAFIEALAARASRHQVELIGGDLSASEKLVVSITMLGRAGARTLLRSGARAGDRLFVSRPLGASAAGLALLQKGWIVRANGSVEPPSSLRAVGYGHRELAESLIRRHVDPEPEVALGVKLGAMDSITACIDLSDGLSTDLRRLCEASGKGAAIDAERLPIFPDLARSGLALGVDGEAAALHGGEDYALLFTSRLRESQLSEQLGSPVYLIGHVTEERGIFLERGGSRSPLEERGYDHFR